MKSKLSIVRCANYEPDRVYESVKESLSLLGGISEFIKPKSRVLVKPNLLMAKEPEFGVDTHPEAVRAVIKLLKQIGCEILVGDGPSVWGNQIENVDEVYRRSGIKKYAMKNRLSWLNSTKEGCAKNFRLPPGWIIAIIW